MPNKGAVTYTPGTADQTVAAGYHNGAGKVEGDADLVAGNIKSGVDIFGVTGSYAGTICTGNATTADVLYPKTFSNSSSTGLTGQRYGGCTCTCAGCSLNGTRWCDNGDGTVTDLTTCLVWLKKADWGGMNQWEDCSGHNDAHTRASVLQAGTSGADLSDGSVRGDWRLPTLSELKALTTGAEAVSSGNMRAFTGVRSSGYWSSTAYPGYAYYAWYAYLVESSVNYDDKRRSLYVWPVRGGQ
jgi:hypothetical protein